MDLHSGGGGGGGGGEDEDSQPLLFPNAFRKLEERKEQKQEKKEKQQEEDDEKKRQFHDQKVYEKAVSTFAAWIMDDLKISLGGWLPLSLVSFFSFLRSEDVLDVIQK